MMTTRLNSKGGNGRARRAVLATLRRSGLAAVLLAGAASPAGAAVLQEMDYTALPGDAVQINFTFDEAVDEPQSFKTANPARVALDFKGASNGLDERSLDVGVGAVTGISTAEAGGRTRAVIQLSDLVPYKIQTDDRIVQVRMEAPGSKGSGGSGGATASSGGSTEGQSSDAAEGNRITSIDFRRGSDGSGKVIVGLNNSSVPADVSRSGNTVVADFQDTRVPERLRRKLDVTDFATPVKSVTTRQRGSSVRITLEPSRQTYDQVAYQADKSFTVELKPLTEEEKEQKQEEEFQYTGERLSLNFQDIEVRSVLQLIADFTGINIVVSDSVSGNITLRLQNVPWDQALAIVLRSKGLDKRKRGNVMWVAPADEIAERERQRAKAREQQQDLAPLRSEFIRVNYAKAEQLASLVSGEGDAQKLLSDRGSVSVDQRTNTMIVRDTVANLEDVRRLVNRLDIPVRQVEIESRVVLATTDFSKDLGVNFGYSQRENVDIDGDDDGFGIIGGTEPGVNEPTDGQGNTIPTGFERPDGVEGLITDLPAADPAGSIGLAIGKLGSNLLQLELSAAETENRAEIVSTPRVVTANQKEAFIEQGEEIPFTSSDGDSVETEFKEALLRLGVTPQITPDDRILLDLEVSNDSRGDSTPDGPAIDTQAIGTQVLVDNGETVVLGGVFERTSRDDVTRVPFFGELPVVGRLFRRTTDIENNSELLIFVTPKILDEQLQGRN
jgi:type IV pilus assembly protein PilQ